MKQSNIVIVEDDKELGQWMSEYLQSRGYSCCLIGDGLEALKTIKAEPPSLTILDGRLPGMDGLDLCRELRTFFHAPIIMLTARDEEVDEVLGLQAGADDYLIKPVRAGALLTRIQKNLERHSQSENRHKNEPLVFSTLQIDQTAQAVWYRGEKIKISSKEFELLWVLANNAGKVISREVLVKELRGLSFDGYDRSIDLRVSRLRKKLGDNAAQPFKIKTVWSKGYLFVADAWD